MSSSLNLFEFVANYAHRRVLKLSGYHVIEVDASPSSLECSTFNVHAKDSVKKLAIMFNSSFGEKDLQDHMVQLYRSKHHNRPINVRTVSIRDRSVCIDSPFKFKKVKLLSKNPKTKVKIKEGKDELSKVAI